MFKLHFSKKELQYRLLTLCAPMPWYVCCTWLRTMLASYDETKTQLNSFGSKKLIKSPRAHRCSYTYYKNLLRHLRMTGIVHPRCLGSFVNIMENNHCSRCSYTHCADIIEWWSKYQVTAFVLDMFSNGEMAVEGNGSQSLRSWICFQMG